MVLSLERTPPGTPRGSSPGTSSLGDSDSDSTNVMESQEGGAVLPVAAVAGAGDFPDRFGPDRSTDVPQEYG